MEDPIGPLPNIKRGGVNQVEELQQFGHAQIEQPAVSTLKLRDFMSPLGDQMLSGVDLFVHHILADETGDRSYGLQR